MIWDGNEANDSVESIEKLCCKTIRVWIFCFGHSSNSSSKRGSSDSEGDYACRSGIRTYMYKPVMLHLWTTTFLGLPDLYEDFSLVAVGQGSNSAGQLYVDVVYACPLGG